MVEMTGPPDAHTVQKGGETYTLPNPHSEDSCDTESLAYEKEHGLSGAARRNERRGWETWVGSRAARRSALGHSGFDSERRAAGEAGEQAGSSQIGGFNRLLSTGGEIVKIEEAGGPGERGQVLSWTRGGHTYTAPKYAPQRQPWPCHCGL